MPRGRGRGRIGGGARRGRGRGRGGSTEQFLAPRTGRQAGAAANAAASAEYNPEIRQLRQEARGSRKREGDLGRWYAQLAADYRGAQSTGAAALQSVQDTTSRQLAEAGDRSSADLSKLISEDEKLAALSGGPKDTAGLTQIAQAGAAAERSRVALGQPVAQEQANFVGRLGGDKAAARMKGIEARGEERDRRLKIRSDLVGARKEKGAARATRKEEIRGADRDYATTLKQMQAEQQEARAAEQQAAADTALAQIEASREAEQDAIGNRMEQERIGISRRNARTSERSQRASARSDREDKKGGLSTAEKRARGEHKSDAMSAAKALLGIKVPKNEKQWSQFQAALIEKLGSSYSAEAVAAVQKIRATQKKKNRQGYKGRVRLGW